MEAFSLQQRDTAGIKMKNKTIKVGCCGWAESRQEYFKHFPIIEIQKTFYQPPARIETVRKWREIAPEDSQYTIKSWQLITHPSSSPTYRRLETKIAESKRKNYGFFRPTKEVFEAWERTKGVAEALGAKIIVFQCPASFTPETQNIENLRKFFKKIADKNFIYIWEPRGVWDPGLVKNLCQELNLVHCVDPFKQGSLWGKINYFRLHGRNGYNLRYKYTDQDLKELVKFCDKKENYVLFNNLSMLKDALKFKALLK